MYQPTRYPGDKQTIVDLELHRMLQFLLFHLEHVVQSLGLSDCSREAVEDEARPAFSGEG